MKGVMNALMKKLLMKCQGGAVLLALASCTSVQLTEPLPFNTSSETRASLEGVWKSEDGVITVKFDAKGVGHAASIQWSDEKQKFEIEDQQFSLTSISGGLYLCGHYSDDEEKAYLLAKCARVEGNFIIWGANTSAFKELIAAKKLKGSVGTNKHSTTVALSSSTKDIMNLLEKSKRKDLFNFEEPMILTKVSGE